MKSENRKMIKYKTLQGNKTLVIEDGKFMLFDSSGNLEKENCPILSSYLNYLLDGNFISLLFSEDNLDIYTILSNGKTQNYSMKRDPFIMQKFLDFGHMTRVLQRTGKENNIRYNQVIYIYQKDIDVNWIVEEILKTC